jgi:hypothetical protein
VTQQHVADFPGDLGVDVDRFEAPGGRERKPQVGLGHRHLKDTSTVRGGTSVALIIGNAALGRHPGRLTRPSNVPYITDGRLKLASRHAL